MAAPEHHSYSLSCKSSEAYSIHPPCLFYHCVCLYVAYTQGYSWEWPWWFVSSTPGAKVIPDCYYEGPLQQATIWGSHGVCNWSFQSWVFCQRTNKLILSFLYLPNPRKTTRKSIKIFFFKCNYRDLNQ